MVPLPVIVGFGGINPAGRSSFHHAYRRMVAPSLPADQVRDTYLGLATMMGLLQHDAGAFKDAGGNTIDVDAWLIDNKALIDSCTLVRKLGNELFDPSQLRRHVMAQGKLADQPITFTLRKRQLPNHIPENWSVKPLESGELEITVRDSLDVLLPDHTPSLVNSAGQLPSGFDPGALYPSRNHPRGLQMTVYAASDALGSMGIDWDVIQNKVSPDDIAVYATSGMSQMDQNANGGLLQARLKGKRVSSKQLALGFPEMPADFVNAYILGSIGGAGGQVGACATFLYNLRQGIEDIRSGNKRVVLVGNSEAPITPEVIDGYHTMGALADDAGLRALDGVSEIDHRRACRPFSSNCGFTLSESAQFFVLFDDQLALELGAHIYGGVGDVFVNADGFKKSISGPGIGNYVTMAKAAASTRAILGDEGLKRSFVQAHGTGTPKNRVTESHILSETARAFGIEDWPVVAIKSYVGHSIAAAAADQLAATLGVWEYGVLPGITTIDHIAEDVHQDRIQLLMANQQVDPQQYSAAILNSKGFGGNNASAGILAPHEVSRMLEKRHGSAAISAYEKNHVRVAEQSQAYDASAVQGLAEPVYRFGEDVKGEDSVTLTDTELRVDGYLNPISLKVENPYAAE